MRNFVYEEAVARIAEELSLPKKFVDRVYRAYWKAVREHIAALPLKDDLTDEEFSKLQPNVNIPSIGKLYVTSERYRWCKDKFEYIRQLRENQKDNAEDNED
jgi:hypothetical protein